MSAKSEPFTATPVDFRAFDFDSTFRTHYPRIARIIRRIVNNPARAEELAVDVFWKLWRNPAAHTTHHVAGWLIQVAVRTALDELRKQSRREKYESIFGRFAVAPPTPEQAHFDNENQRRVRSVLSALKSDQATLLVLRSDGCSYQEMAEALACNATSIGTLLGRAQQAFRREYTKRYGHR